MGLALEAHIQTLCSYSQGPCLLTRCAGHCARRLPSDTSHTALGLTPPWCLANLYYVKQTPGGDSRAPREPRRPSTHPDPPGETWPQGASWAAVCLSSQCSWTVVLPGCHPVLPGLLVTTKGTPLGHQRAPPCRELVGGLEVHGGVVRGSAAPVPSALGPGACSPRKAGLHRPSTG